MEAKRSPGASASLCVVLLLSSYALVQLLVPTLQSSPSATIIGGVLCSGFSFLLVTLLGNLQELTSPSRSQGHVEAIVSIAGAATVAWAIHPVSATVSTFFSIVTVWYVSRVSKEVYSGSGTSNTKKSTRSRR
ncbi:hypothetical protein NDN08_007826 [Rhodosorus marinus]|uniref:Dolichyl-diphosphooligosaccharide--protein glycosyltransferase subunit KCP2 n=1 Tax=Rhodosorus marinus TaxID=101924 RepID=A0AAV8UZU9_9RHOD|nr:hypothetical protein NDN08_007826 [Rhodosorus marinus]